MSAALEIASWVFLVAGAGFCVIGGIGLLRMPDFYARTHAAGITDTMGAGLVLMGLMLQAPTALIGNKLLIILGFLWLVGPTAGHALFKAAYADGVKIHEGRDIAARIADETSSPSPEPEDGDAVPD
ncbi:MAG: monovalent cation/H(+) antiporter subunit G [Planctomycetota bacterium]|nr:monovalent cation/H(+) antiporter subunit G [Planctomycetota bacterium]